MIDEKLSYRIRWGTYISTMFVVLRHSLNNYAFYDNAVFDSSIVAFIENGFIRITDMAVPFFFLVSGYFFLSKTYSIKEGTFGMMLKKKIRSLLIPFAIWNIVGGCVLFFYDRELLGCDFESICVNLLTSQWYGPLWYVRDLMILMVAYPIYGWLLRKNIICSFILIIVLVYLWSPGDTSVLSWEGILFFFMGGFLNKVQINFNYSKVFCCALVIAWILVSFIQNFLGNIFVMKANILLGILAFWGVCYMVSLIPKSRTQHLFSYGFLIYVLHFYLEKALKVSWGHVFKNDAVMAVCAFFIVPIATVLLICLFGKYFKVKYPKYYNISTGAR